jgi:cell division protein FtsB
MEVDARRIASRLVAGSLVAIATYYAFWGGEYTAFDLGRLGIRQQEEASRLTRTRAEVDSLKSLAVALESDPAMIERVARERFGMVRQGEILYRFVELETDTREVALAK